ncbi:MAG TPA: carboxypeptidase-like regulatory domain-containing protein [Bryobacteraceae bacterium]
MRSLVLVVCLGTSLTAVAFGQSDRGTITGTISDPGGAILANTPVQAKHVETGTVYQAASSATGNYTLSELPTGTYEITITAQGFKNFVRQNIILPVGQTIRIDATLQVGSVSESVVVSDVAPLLKTESGELSHNVSIQTLDNLPVFQTGSNASVSGIRNPYSAVEEIPGSASFATGEGLAGLRINGNPSNTQSMRIEGQDATNNWYYYQSMTQPSVEAIQEFSVQTSNFAAEFGRVGGGLFNATMKSGTNQFHGSAYDYFANEALNAGTPFTSNGHGGLLRPVNRRNDWGATFGGPVYLPKLYNGHDKLFFFFNFEQFLQTTVTNNVSTTIPTLAYRTGNFQQALTGAVIGTDPLGRTLYANTIYDPASTFLTNGLQERNPFPNNTIPPTELDPVALRIQSLIPPPTSSGLVNNYEPTYRNPRDTFIPSLKLDDSLSPLSAGLCR